MVVLRSSPGRLESGLGSSNLCQACLRWGRNTAFRKGNEGSLVSGSSLPSCPDSVRLLHCGDFTGLTGDPLLPGLQPLCCACSPRAGATS